MNQPLVPSPIPPWSNPPVSPLVQTVFGNDTVVLGVDTTYLQQATPGPYTVVLPNGTYQRQYHTIIVPSGFQAGTANFKVTGAFNGFVTLLFNTGATSAVLTWDGAGWVLIGGNAQASQSA